MDVDGERATAQLGVKSPNADAGRVGGDGAAGGSVVVVPAAVVPGGVPGLVPGGVPGLVLGGGG